MALCAAPARPALGAARQPRPAPRSPPGPGPPPSRAEPLRRRGKLWPVSAGRAGASAHRLPGSSPRPAEPRAGGGTGAVGGGSGPGERGAALCAARGAERGAAVPVGWRWVRGSLSGRVLL